MRNYKLLPCTIKGTKLMSLNNSKSLMTAILVIITSNNSLNKLANLWKNLNETKINSYKREIITQYVFSVQFISATKWNYLSCE